MKSTSNTSVGYPWYDLLPLSSWENWHQGILKTTGLRLLLWRVARLQRDRFQIIVSSQLMLLVFKAPRAISLSIWSQFESTWSNPAWSTLKLTSSLGQVHRWQQSPKLYHWKRLGQWRKQQSPTFIWWKTPTPPEVLSVQTAENYWFKRTVLSGLHVMNTLTSLYRCIDNHMTGKIIPQRILRKTYWVRYNRQRTILISSDYLYAHVVISLIWVIVSCLACGGWS